MLDMLAIVLPPLAVLNVGLTMLVWIPGVIHAFTVVIEHKANQRARKYGQNPQRASSDGRPEAMQAAAGRQGPARCVTRLTYGRRNSLHRPAAPPYDTATTGIRGHSPSVRHRRGIRPRRSSSCRHHRTP